jgi:hypothetical protein
MHDPIANDGPWIGGVFVGRKKEDGFKQGYPPHASLPPSKAKSGAILRFEAIHSDLANRFYHNVPNGCIIP